MGMNDTEGVVFVLNTEIKTTEPLTVAYIPMRGAYSQIPEAMGRLYAWVMQHGLMPSGMPHAVYMTSPADTPEDEAVWELWAPLGGDRPDAELDEAGVGIKHVEPMVVASGMHRGPYETVDATYNEMWAWVVESGYQVTGPPMEIYYSDPNEVSPEEYLTEVQMPISLA